MHPMLTEALVAPRIQDLRRSAQIAGASGMRGRAAARATPLPAWAVTVRPRRPVPAMGCEPCGCGEPT